MGGVVWFARAVIELYRPDYWNPRTPLDYAAVAGTSLALLTLAFGLWGFYLYKPAPPSRAQSVWRGAVMATCGSATIVGISNFIEDALGVQGLGFVWVIGILTLLTGLLIAGVSALWVKAFSRWVGGLILLCAFSLPFIAGGGMFGPGLALSVLGLLKDTNL
jgi:hypothetical protein